MTDFPVVRRPATAAALVVDEWLKAAVAISFGAVFFVAVAGILRWLVNAPLPFVSAEVSRTLGYWLSMSVFLLPAFLFLNLLGAIVARLSIRILGALRR